VGPAGLLSLPERLAAEKHGKLVAKNLAAAEHAKEETAKSLGLSAEDLDEDQLPLRRQHHDSSPTEDSIIMAAGDLKTEEDEVKYRRA
jgi:hypothetical protein